MRSESFRRLQSVEPVPLTNHNSAMRDRIAQQVAEYEARGGTITRLDSALSEKVVRDAMTGKVLAPASSEVVDGVTLLSIHRVMKITGLSRSTIGQGVHSGRFPAPVKQSGRARQWDEADVLRWMVEQGGAASV